MSWYFLALLAGNCAYKLKKDDGISENQKCALGKGAIFKMKVIGFISTGHL